MFRDDPSLAPGGRLYLPNGTHGAIADFDQADNVLFNRCDIRLTHNAQLPWTVRAIYRDCVMNQRSPIQGYPRGTFHGTTIINGNVDLYGSKFLGRVIRNGRG
jgi:hypothetical protein